VNPSGPGLLFVGRLFIAALVSLLVIDLMKLFTSSWFTLVGHMHIEIYPFLLDFIVY
jgi:hypothetical protein